MSSLAATSGFLLQGGLVQLHGPGLGSAGLQGGPLRVAFHSGSRLALSLRGLQAALGQHLGSTVGHSPAELTWWGTQGDPPHLGAEAKTWPDS